MGEVHDLRQRIHHPAHHVRDGHDRAVSGYDLPPVRGREVPGLAAPVGSLRRLAAVRSDGLDRQQAGDDPVFVGQADEQMQRHVFATWLGNLFSRALNCSATCAR